METPPPPPPNPQTKTNTKSSPPKRGQIKAQIFESLANTVSSFWSKAGETLGMLGRRGGGGGGGSTAGSPPPSSYNSDGNFESVSSKGGEKLGMPRCGGGSPPPGSYNSDGNSELPEK